MTAMDLLCTAVVDITTLTATCRALARGPVAGKLRTRHKLRDKLRTEVRHGVEAYIDTLARSKRGVLDDRRLTACRVAAEAHMTRALHHQWALNQLMNTAPDALLGVAAARQDLWRLAHMVIHLRQGVAVLRYAGGNVDAGAAKKTGTRLRRRLTRALMAYARVRQRSSDSEEHMIVFARKAALRAIGRHGTSEADSLGQAEAAVGALQPFIRMGVVKPMADLFLDWGQPDIQPQAVSL